MDDELQEALSRLQKLTQRVNDVLSHHVGGMPLQEDTRQPILRADLVELRERMGAAIIEIERVLPQLNAVEPPDEPVI